MKKWNVTIPTLGEISVQVEVDDGADEQAAIKAAWVIYEEKGPGAFEENCWEAVDDCYRGLPATAELVRETLVQNKKRK